MDDVTNDTDVDEGGMLVDEEEVLIFDGLELIRRASSTVHS